MRRKTAETGPRREITYKDERWERLERLRETAGTILETLAYAGMNGLVYGSVARGDVSKTSDVDIVVPRVVPSYRVEIALEHHGIIDRRLVMATPRALPKAHVEVEDVMITIPLSPPTPRELDFYRFGGAINLQELNDDRRVPGVDKRLMLIHPTGWGHVEEPIQDLSPGVVAKAIGVGQSIVEERIRVLGRRAEVGRTGVYVNRRLAPDETFEQVLDQIAAEDPAIRRRVRG